MPIVTAASIESRTVNSNDMEFGLFRRSLFSQMIKFFDPRFSHLLAHSIKRLESKQ